MTLDPYRIAYEQASEELKEIGELFDGLRLRKDRIERLILAFEPLIEMSEPAPARVEEVEESLPAQASEEIAEPPAAVAAEAASDPSSYSFLEVPAPLPDLPPGPNDPFQRRAFRFRGLSGEHRGIQRGA